MGLIRKAAKPATAVLPEEVPPGLLGFDTNPKQSLFFADGVLNGDDSFTASAYNRSQAPATLTAYKPD